ncbi:MAG: YkgJ family cysteine cluster protein [Desulfovibrionaceae bacterium]
MALDFTPFFKRYEALRDGVDKIFIQVQAQYGDLVHCGKGCSDCCYALFDLSLVEAIYINHHFNARYEGRERSRILERADEADRAVYRLKRQIYKASQDGRPAPEILAEVARQRVRCPLLGEENLCVLYEQRPLTCRLYGIPMVIGETAHTCHHSGFEPGKSYPTIQTARLQDQLFDLSGDLARAIGSAYQDLGGMLVPLSMALLTDYDEAYLGVRSGGSCATCASDVDECGQTPGACSGAPDSVVIGGGDGKDKA